MSGSYVASLILACAIFGLVVHGAADSFRRRGPYSLPLAVLAGIQLALVIIDVVEGVRA